MRKKIFLYLCTLTLGCAFGQDVHFSQYYVAPQLINPAGFGVLNSFEAGLQYKGQWNSFTNGYKSYAAFANKSFRKQSEASSSKAYLSAGLNVIYDQAGSTNFNSFKAEIPVNVTKRVSSAGFLTAGIYLGYGQLSANAGSFTWGNQFDGYQYNSSMSSNESSPGATHSYLDCGAGISHTAVKKGTEQNLPLNVIGFSVGHLNRPGYSLYSSPGDALGMRLNFYELYHIYFQNSPLSVVPSVLVQYQSKASEVVVGALLKRMFKNDDPKKTKFASVGLFYRLQDMCALNGMIELNNYMFGLNYDFNVSKLTTSSRSFGGLELSFKVINPFQYSYKNSSKLIDKKI